jgi:glutamine amidotransferase
MCRLLAVRSVDGNYFKITDHLVKFSVIARESREYQGHGWGCAYRKNGKWELYRSIQPIWEDNLQKFGQTNILIVHCRSAFRDEGIRVENNMPFADSDQIFIFNGELQGVKIKEKGRIGAQKIFNFIRRFHLKNLNFREAFKKAIMIIERRSSYIKAMNCIIADEEKVYYCCFYNENREYYSLKRRLNSKISIICSDPYPGEGEEWREIKNRELGVFA